MCYDNERLLLEEISNVLIEMIVDPEDINRDYINPADSRPTVGSADKMPDLSSFFISRQKIKL